MPYAIQSNGISWRVINTVGDLLPGETYSDTQPPATSIPQTPAEAAIVARQASSRLNAQNIPDWATWTAAQWQTWYSANMNGTQITAITNLADAKVVLGKMSTAIDALSKMVIAMRDYIRIIE